MFSTIAHADSNLADFLSEQMDRAQESVCEASAEGQDSFELNRFFLNLSAPVSIGVSGVDDLSVAPEIEFVWEKVQ